MTWALVITYCWLVGARVECERSVREAPSLPHCLYRLVRSVRVKASNEMAVSRRCTFGQVANIELYLHSRVV